MGQKAAWFILRKPEPHAAIPLQKARDKVIGATRGEHMELSPAPPPEIEKNVVEK